MTITLAPRYDTFNAAWTCDVLHNGRCIGLTGWYETEANARRAGRRMAQRKGWRIE